MPARTTSIGSPLKTPPLRKNQFGGTFGGPDRYGSRIVMGGHDWDSIEKPVHGYAEGKPKRDIVADDGQKITLGDTAVKTSPF